MAGDALDHSWAARGSPSGDGNITIYGHYYHIWTYKPRFYSLRDISLEALSRRNITIYGHYYHIWTCKPRFYSLREVLGSNPSAAVYALANCVEKSPKATQAMAVTRLSNGGGALQPLTRLVRGEGDSSVNAMQCVARLGSSPDAGWQLRERPVLQGIIEDSDYYHIWTYVL